MGYCGEDCEKCDCYVATVNDDDNLRVVVAAMWTNQYGHEFTPDMINCLGCKSDGVKCGYCDMCEIRKCAVSKGIDCKDCKEYPCKKINDFFHPDDHSGVNA